MEVMYMPSTQIQVQKIVFNVEGRILSLDKDLAERYSETVCPVTDEYAEIMVKLFGRECRNDDVMSYAVAEDMAKELHEYNYGQ